MRFAKYSEIEVVNDDYKMFVFQEINNKIKIKAYFLMLYFINHT